MAASRSEDAAMKGLQEPNSVAASSRVGNPGTSFSEKSGTSKGKGERKRRSQGGLRMASGAAGGGAAGDGDSSPEQYMQHRPSPPRVQAVLATKSTNLEVSPTDLEQGAHEFRVCISEGSINRQEPESGHRPYKNRGCPGITCCYFFGSVCLSLFVGLGLFSMFFLFIPLVMAVGTGNTFEHEFAFNTHYLLGPFITDETYNKYGEWMRQHWSDGTVFDPSTNTNLYPYG